MKYLESDGLVYQLTEEIYDDAVDWVSDFMFPDLREDEALSKFEKSNPDYILGSIVDFREYSTDRNTERWDR